jgi:hypothetical protein
MPSPAWENGKRSGVKDELDEDPESGRSGIVEVGRLDESAKKEGRALLPGLLNFDPRRLARENIGCREPIIGLH